MSVKNNFCTCTLHGSLFQSGVAILESRSEKTDKYSTDAKLRFKCSKKAFEKQREMGRNLANEDQG